MLGRGFRYDLACTGEPLPEGICALVHKLLFWKRFGCRVLGIKHGDSQIKLHLFVLGVFWYKTYFFLFFHVMGHCIYVLLKEKNILQSFVSY